MFQSNEDCLDLTNKILENREEFHRDRPALNYNTRYCSQEKINIMVCGGYNKFEEECDEITDLFVTKVDAEKFDKFESIAGFSGCYYFWSINVVGELYVLSKHKNVDTLNIHKYYNEKNTWVKVKVINTSRDNFSVCSFLNRIYIIGGHYKNNIAVNSRFEIDTTSCKSKPIKRMNEAIISAGCVSFQGKMVVSGGSVDFYRRLNNLNTV